MIFFYKIEISTSYKRRNQLPNFYLQQFTRSTNNSKWFRTKTCLFESYFKLLLISANFIDAISSPTFQKTYHDRKWILTEPVTF